MYGSVTVELRRRRRRDVRPLRSASLNLSSQGIGTKTQFSGLGVTPTGDLREIFPLDLGQVNNI